MDYEKKYKEALERAKEYLEEYYSEEAVKDIFPELAESEDERIRKELMDFIYVTCFPVKDLKKKERFLDWLEKQGEIDMKPYKEAEDEKREFVGDGFIKCYADFQDFKEGETYWLEYVGNDNYNVRSDNLLGKTYHITPCQLYTIFKKQTWLEKQDEKKPNWREEDEEMRLTVLQDLQNIKESYPNVNVEPEFNWLKSLKPQSQWKPSDEQIRPLEYAIDYFKKKKIDTAYLKSLYNDLKKLKGE